MAVQITAFACAACLYVMAAVLWSVSRRVTGSAPLRDAALAQAIVGSGLLVRVWAPSSEYGPVLVLATITYGAHGVWMLAALRQLRGLPAHRGGILALLAAASGCAAWGLVDPVGALAGLGLSYMLIAALYAFCVQVSLAGVAPSHRSALGLVAAGGVLCTLLYVFWGSMMLFDPAWVLSQASADTLAASFLFGLWINLLATCGYLLLVFRQLLERIEAHALLDPLTGLPNRRGLRRHVDQAVVRAGRGRHDTPIGVIAIDIDHFKRINDTHGHAGGDIVLAACAQRLASQLRRTDVVARMGGEEFVAALEDADAELIAAVAERMRRAIEAEPVALPNGQLVAVTISLGTAQAPAASLRLDAAMQHADGALYAAKQAGRNRVVHGGAVLEAAVG